jgi:TMEM175 potassium channel family protein
MSTTRLEAFSDGVFAIAITLLVLEIHVPEGGGLWGKLGDLWPSYVGYGVSFLTIGIIWVNHHSTFARIDTVDRPLLFLNLLLLLWVAFLPFPTALVAEHIREGTDEDVAAAVYAGSLLLMGAAFFTTAVYAHRLHRLPREVLRTIAVRNAVGQGGYAVALAVAFVNAPVSLAICGLVAVYYVFPGRDLGSAGGGVTAS